MEKVLIIAGALHIGGAERIAANICCYAPAEQFEFHYVVFEGYENAYGAEIEARGGRVFTLPSPKKGYLRYCRLLAELIRTHRYSVVHSHTQFNSGINLLVSKALHVPIRIAHSHTTKTEGRVSLPQNAYEHLMRWVIRKTATHLLACGVEAGRWMFGRKAFDAEGIVLRNGIDPAANAYSPSNREKTRACFGIDPNAFVIGHAGTLLPLKNQEFLIRLMPEILKARPDAVLLLLGAGSPEERARLEAIASESGVKRSVLFGGGVHNVCEILSAMDVFAFPSLREGTPLALLEAQANGLPCVVSNRIPKDAFLTDLITALPLENPEAWIGQLLRAKRENSFRYAEELVRVGYDFSGAYHPLYTIYRSIATVSLSFDDGRGDNTEAVDRLFLPAGLPVTLNITTGYVDHSCPPELLPSPKAPMQKEDVQRLAASPLVEIAMHGDCHQNTLDDIQRCREKLTAWLGSRAHGQFGFASPGSGMSLDWFRSEEAGELRDDVAYLRTSLRIRSLGMIRVLSRKAARVLHLPFLYRIAYHDTVMTECDSKILYSVPVMRDITPQQIRAVLRSCVHRRGALVLMFHSVDEDAASCDAWSWSKEKMQVLSAVLLAMQKQGTLALCTSVEQFARLQERK